MKWWDWMPWSSFSKCWVLSQLFHSPLSLSSRGSLLSFKCFFTFCHKGGVICISEVIDIFPGNLDFTLCFIQPDILHDVKYKLNKQGDNIQPWCTPFRSGTSLLFHVQFSLLILDLHTDFSGGRSGGLLYHFFKNFPQFVVIHTVKGFGVVNKAEVDIFLELSCFFDDATDVGNLISGSSAFSKSCLKSGSSWFMYCWSLAWRVLSITLLAC